MGDLLATQQLEETVNRWTSETAPGDHYALVLPEQVGMTALGETLVMGRWRQRYVNGEEKPWVQMHAVKFGIAGLALPPHAIAYRHGMWQGLIEARSDWDASVELSSLAVPVLLHGQDRLPEVLHQPDQADLPGYKESRRVIADIILKWLGAAPQNRQTIATNAQLIISSSMPRHGENDGLVSYVRSLADGRAEADKPEYFINFRRGDGKPIVNLVLRGVQGSVRGAKARESTSFYRGEIVVPLTEIAIPDDKVLQTFRTTFADEPCTPDNLRRFLDQAIHPVTVAGGNFLPNIAAHADWQGHPNLPAAAVASAVRDLMALLPSQRRLRVGAFGHFQTPGAKMQISYEPAGSASEFYRSVAKKIGVRFKIPK